jgi:hypothetical protein
MRVCWIYRSSMPVQNQNGCQETSPAEGTPVVLFMMLSNKITELAKELRNAE